MAANSSRNLGFFDIQLFPSLHDNADNASIPAEIIQDERDIAHLHFHEVTWVGSHNAHANKFAAGDDPVRLLATNQEFSIYKQLKEVGVRALQLDLKHDGTDIRLFHGLVAFSSLHDILRYEIAPFLDEDPDAIITLDLETLGVRAPIMRDLRVMFQQIPGFTNCIFHMSDDRWANHTEWPTIQEMRDADQRVVVFSDSTIVQSKELGIMYRGAICLENHWLKGLDACSPRNEYFEDLDIPWASRTVYGNTWTRLFLLSHFCCTTGFESLRRANPDNIGGGDNGWGVLYPRIMHCMEENGHGQKPNFIAVDWAHIGDAHEVADYLNFGGRLGTGQPCRSGLDCATGSCSPTLHRCQCQICDGNCTSGCDIDETCVSVEGVHECESNGSGLIVNAITSSAANDHQSQCSMISTVFQVLIFLKLWSSQKQ